MQFELVFYPSQGMRYSMPSLLSITNEGLHFVPFFRLQRVDGRYKKRLSMIYRSIIEPEMSRVEP